MCDECSDYGVEGGCPECGIWPWEKQKIVAGKEYHLVTSVRKGEELHRQYQRLKKKGVQILLVDATDRWRKPFPPWIELWVSDEAVATIEKAGIFCL